MFILSNKTKHRNYEGLGVGLVGNHRGSVMPYRSVIPGNSQYLESRLLLSRKAKSIDLFYFKQIPELGPLINSIICFTFLNQKKTQKARQIKNQPSDEQSGTFSKAEKDTLLIEFNHD